MSNALRRVRLLTAQAMPTPGATSIAWQGFGPGAGISGAASPLPSQVMWIC